MKRSISLVLALLMVASLMTFGAISSSAAMTTLVASGSEWSYMWYHDDGTSEDGAQLPEGWYEKDFDASEWTKGNAPFTGVHYANANANTQLDNDGAKKLTLAAVQKFQATDVSSIENVVFKLFFDENPVVYINGKKVHVGSGYNSGLATIDPNGGEVSIKEALVEGENTIAVYMENNINGGGFHMDLSMEVGTPDLVDENGYVNVKKADCSNYVPGTGDPSHMLDDVAGTCCGAGFNNQEWTLEFYGDVAVSEIYLQSKTKEEPGYGEGNFDDANYTGDPTIFGFYSVYVGDTLVATKVPARAAVDGGFTLKLSNAITASSVKVVCTEWLCSPWANINTLKVKAAETAESAVQYFGTQGSNVENAVRFIASTSSLDFDAVGMMISTTDKDGNPKSWNVSTKKVYAALNAANGPVAADEGESLYGVELYGIPEGTYTFTIVPYGKTANGIVLGKAATVTATVSANGSTIAE